MFPKTHRGYEWNEFELKVFDAFKKAKFIGNRKHELHCIKLIEVESPNIVMVQVWRTSHKKPGYEFHVCSALWNTIDERLVA